MTIRGKPPLHAEEFDALVSLIKVLVQAAVARHAVGHKDTLATLEERAIADAKAILVDVWKGLD